MGLFSPEGRRERELYLTRTKFHEKSFVDDGGMAVNGRKATKLCTDRDRKPGIVY